MSAQLPPPKKDKTPKPKVQKVEAEAKYETILWIPTAEIHTPQVRARSSMTPDGLEELTKSIHGIGLIEPIIVRKVDKGYQLIAGERRLTAVKELEWPTIPARVIEASEISASLMTAVENLQRENADPMGEAAVYEHVVKVGKITEKDVARKIGKSREYVANRMRLLNLPSSIHHFVTEGALEPSLAIELLPLNEKIEMEQMAETVMKEGFNRSMVRDAVKFRKQVLAGEQPSTTTTTTTTTTEGEPMPVYKTCLGCGQSRDSSIISYAKALCAICWDNVDLALKMIREQEAEKAK